MVEDIKNEILTELKNIGKTPEDDGLISLRHLFEILDKYKEQEIDKTKFIEEFLEANPYKKAWEELMNLYNITFKDTMSKNDNFVLHTLKNLEQKHNIGE